MICPVKIRRAENLFQLHQKWCLFLQLAAEKKTPFLVQLKQIFGPSYFVTALEGQKNLKISLTVLTLLKVSKYQKGNLHWCL